VLVEQELPPDPGVLLKSLRGIGYSVEDAVADIVDNSLSAGARSVEIQVRDVHDDVVIDIVDDGTGLSTEELLIALTLGARERDPGLTRREQDLGRFGLGLKTASFSVAKRLALYGTRDGRATGAAWDLEAVSRSRQWLLSKLTEDEHKELASALSNNRSGTVVRWSKTDRLGLSTTKIRSVALAVLEERLRRHLGMVYHRFLDGCDAEGQSIDQLSLLLNGRPVRGWNPLVPFTDRPELVELGEVRRSHGMRVEYAVLPPDTLLLAEERLQATIDGRRLTDMQGFYVYRGNRLVCFASWLSLPGVGRGRWNKDSSTQLARIAVDLANTSDEEWSLDVRKSRVSPPERDRPVLVEVGAEARLRSRSRIFGRSAAREKHSIAPVPSLWALDQGCLRINRDHPLVSAIVNPAAEASPRALRAAVRSLLRQLEASPSLVALVSEPIGGTRDGVPETANTLDDADFGEALDLGRCLIRSGTPMKTVLEVASEDPRYREDPALLERLRARLELDRC
jgi:hypothetical protein